MITGLGFCAFILGALVSLFNIYLSFVRLPLLKALGRAPQWASPIPLIATILLAFAVLLLDRPRFIAAALVLGLIDPGGLLRFAPKR
jgi:hypothetical protein